MPDLDDFAAGLEAPEHRQLFDYWRSKAPAGRLPGRRHLDPVDIPRLLPWIILYDVDWREGAPRFRFRLVGTGNVQRYGRDATGLWFEEAYDGEALARQQAVFAEVATSRRPHLSRAILPIAGKDHVTYRRLILPLTNDGETVDNLIALMVFDADP